MAAGAEKLSIQTFCCFCWIPRERVSVQHLFFFFFYMAILSTQSQTRCLLGSRWSVLSNWILKTSQEDGKLAPSFEDLPLPRSSVVLLPPVILCFHLSGSAFIYLLFENSSFSVAFPILTMLHCIRSECELKQALMCLSYVVQHYLLRASSLFDEHRTRSTVTWGACTRVQSVLRATLIIRRRPNMERFV